jgi:glyoxylase-like metal-dependent hydrolase (beta-lactamase superfamily II)
MAGKTYKFKVGDFTCIALSDGSCLGDAAFIFSMVNQDELDQVFKSRGMKLDEIPNSWTCLFIDTGVQLVLLDTGFGIGTKPQGGRLIQSLRKAGISADDVDLVLLSHAHTDHLGGSVDQDGTPVFSNARYLIAEAEYNFWTNGNNYSSIYQSMLTLIRKNLSALESQLELFSPDKEFLPGIRSISAFGHTPGHTAFQIQSNDASLLYLSDTILHPLQIENPDWVAIVDNNPDQTISTREVIFNWAASKQLLVHCYHFDFPGLGYILREKRGWRWNAATP